MRRAFVRRRASRGALLASWVMLFGSASPALGHPLHTTITDLGRGGNQTVRATIRVFADDFGRAVLGLRASARAPAESALSDSAAAAYVRAHFTIATPDGRALPLEWCGARRSADLMWVCVHAAWSGPLVGMRIHDRMLFDLYHDQINIVQADDNGRRSSVLFTMGDGPKRLS